MGILSAIRNILTLEATPRYDENGVYRGWRYNKDDETEVEALKSLSEYVKSHGIRPSVVEVYTKKNRVYLTHGRVIGGIENDRFLHYLVYPDWMRSHDYNEYEKGRSGTDWSMTLERATKLDPEYHSKCPFYYTGTCDYCNGPNENSIG